MNKYKVCEICRSLRENNLLDQAINCPSCHGTGMVRNLDSYICNRCGESLCPKGAGGPYGLVETTVSGGYYSPDLSDYTNYTFSLCERCLRQLFSEFKLLPRMYDLNLGEEGGFEFDQHVWKNLEWFSTTEPQLERLAQGRCNAILNCQANASYRIIDHDGLSNIAPCESCAKDCKSIKSLFVPIDLIGRQEADTLELDPKSLLKLIGIYLSETCPTDKPDYFPNHPFLFRQGMDELTELMGNTVWIPTGFTDYTSPPAGIVSYRFDKGTLFGKEKDDSAILEWFEQFNYI